MALVIGSVPRGFEPDANTVIPLPPQNGGAFGWGPVFVSFATDFHDVRLRIAVWNDVRGSWAVSELNVPQNGGRANFWITDGDSKLSVSRIKIDASDPGSQPVGWMIETVLSS